MYLHQSKRKGGIYLSIVEGFREGGKVKHKTLKSLGYVKDLEKDYDDPISYFKSYCEAENAQRKQERQSVAITIHPKQKITKNMLPRKNIGSAVLLGAYNYFHIETVLRNASKGRRFDFDLNAVMRLLVIERILHPASKASAFKNKDGYFFRSAFSLDDMYRALSVFYEAKDRIVSRINRAIDKAGMRDASCTYYDVTNYYFEIDDEDDLRCAGYSKEHRKSPIVQMGLLQDENALPITYRLFPGNTPDASTMIDVLQDMKRQYGCRRIIAVADKGNNTSANIAALAAKGDGFIYSQSIRGTKSNKELRAWVVSENGYRYKNSGTFKIKSRQDYKTITVKDQKGKTKKVDIEVKVVAFWSEKYMLRARKEREKTLEKAYELIENPGAYSTCVHFGAAKYVNGLNIDKDTGEILEGATRLLFDKKRLEADEACDGYYCIITSETDMQDEDIIDAYKGLWRIEESFKVTKSDLKSRPVYVSRQDHIEAHFLTCYIALCILRFIQLKTKGTYSAKEIAESLKNMSGSAIDTNWWLFDYRSNTTDALCKMAGIDLSRKYMQLKDIKAELAKTSCR